MRKNDSVVRQHGKENRVTIGLDLGDRSSRYCVLGEQGKVLSESSVPTTKKGLTQGGTLSGNIMAFYNSAGSPLFLVTNTGSIGSAGVGATGSGDVNLCISTVGFFTKGSTCGSSLARYKENITGLEHGLDYVMQMRPVTFNWKSDGHPDVGLIADEVAAIDPLLGAYDKDGDLYNFKDREVLTTLIKAVQELKVQNDELRTRTVALERQ